MANDVSEIAEKAARSAHGRKAKEEAPAGEAPAVAGPITVTLPKPAESSEQPGEQPGEPTLEPGGEPTPEPGGDPAPEPNGEEAKKSTYKRADTSKIKLDSLALETFAPDETLEIEIDTTGRSDVQQTIDGMVKDAHDAWVAANKPASMTAAIKAGVGKRFFLDPEEADAYRALLNSAGRLLGVKIHTLPVQRHVSGKHMLPWVAMDKRGRTVATPETGNGATSASEPSAPSS